MAKVFPSTSDCFPVQRQFTFKRALTRWLVFARMGKAKTTQHTYRELVKALRAKWREALPWPVEKLTEDEVLRLAMKIAHYSPSRWNGFLQCLRWITPAAKVLKRRTPSLTRLPPPSQTEFAALLAECDKLKRSCARLVIDFLSHSGLRITAARNVRESDVYEDRIEYVGKGGRRCSVPIVNGMVEVLAKLKAIRDGSGYVLPRESVRNGLARACDASGVRRLSHHDFRHLFATRAIESGVDVPTVARWLGHRDGGALLSKRYFHLLDAHSRSMGQRVKIGA